MSAPRVSPTALRLHDAAVSRGEMTYEDPQTGYRVMTCLALEARGHCCQCGCRHCPYGFQQAQSA